MGRLRKHHRIFGTSNGKVKNTSGTSNGMVKNTSGNSNGKVKKTSEILLKPEF
jgi:hypothetical protein